MDEFLEDFLAETAEMLSAIWPQLSALEHCPANDGAFSQILRFLHTVKGTSGFLGLNRLEALTHAGEDLLSRCRHETPPLQAITLIVETLRRTDRILRAIGASGSEPGGSDDDLMFHLAAVAGRAWPSGAARGEALPAIGDGASPLTEVGSSHAGPASSAFGHLAPIASALASSCEQLHQTARRLGRDDWAEPMARLSAAAAELRRGIAGDEMRPIGLAWRALPGIVRDLSCRLGKGIDLELTGAKTLVDVRTLGPLKQSLVHMVRNCADHGLERADQRLAAGKPEAGKITLCARREGSHVTVEVSDDGRGLDASAIGAAALGRSVANADQLAKMDIRQIHQFIFEAGLSTAPEITKVSGRGIGMDVVRANIAAIGGRISVSSKAGEGTKITLIVPQIFSPQVRTRKYPHPQRKAPLSEQSGRRVAA